MKALAMLVACAAVAMGATAARTKTVGDEEVIPGPSFTAQELVTITGLKFYACNLKRNGADCTIVVGYATCHLPHQNYVVTLTFTVWDTLANVVSKGAFSVELDRPKPGVPVKFEALGPAWHAEQARGEDRRPVKAQYALSVDIRGYKAPKFHAR